MNADVQTGVVLALGALVPLLVLMVTSFVKISIVLALLRNALGASDAPSGLVVMGMSLVLTVFVMAPVALEMVDAAATQVEVTDPQGQAAGFEAAARQLAGPDHQEDIGRAIAALGPLREFLTKHADPGDRDTFAALARELGRSDGDELWVLAPAFLATELREAFAIAVLIFLPFLILDLVVGLALAALGLSATSPQTVALPLKLLLFVSVDGWRLLLDSLVRGYV